MRITNNIPSLIAQRLTRQGYAQQSRALEHLATGSRISRAKDDPAGLVASEFIKADIARLGAEVRVLGRIDAVVSTAEGALSEVSDLLTQAEAIIVGVANRGGVSPEEFDAAQLEFDSILATIDRIADTSRFNGRRLLDGSAVFSFGDASITIRDVSSRALGLRGLDLRDGETAQDFVRAASKTVSVHRGELGGFQQYVVGAGVRTREIAMENLSAMNSFIRDADYAVETAELVRSRIITQAAVQSLLIAGRQVESVLSLLAGARF